MKRAGLHRIWHCLSDSSVHAGKLTRGAEPDTSTAAKMVLLDWQRGRLPFFTLPPGCSATPDETRENLEDTPAAAAADAQTANVSAAGAPEHAVLAQVDGQQERPNESAAADALALVSGGQYIAQNAEPRKESTNVQDVQVVEVCFCVLCLELLILHELSL